MSLMLSPIINVAEMGAAAKLPISLLAGEMAGRPGRNIPDTLLKHISPLSWEHINLTGIYIWDTEHQMPEGFRTLRLPTPTRRAA
ncbi:DDE_Tnp_Tn3 domain-containing protein [Mesorhizobium escarrei]|uniref:Tn3 transposase DDE domain-containing protein n=2 Tax=Mesorhizobium TaxID=68287 RepID=A0A2P9AMP9_9HYPH|nr:DDE_Tnp_Tn3 domain-containing protein [Mesorhizobium escarrei]SJM32427.1 hypothetical protein BQ8482_290022 [Mesorhizobium delmotii]